MRGPAPTLGRHNEEVLLGILGISRERYEQLERDQVTGTVYTEDAARSHATGDDIRRPRAAEMQRHASANVAAVPLREEPS